MDYSNIHPNLLGGVGAWTESSQHNIRTQERDAAQEASTSYDGPSLLDGRLSHDGISAGDTNRPGFRTLGASADVPVVPASHHARRIFEVAAGSYPGSSTKASQCRNCGKELRDLATLRHHEMTHNLAKVTRHRCPVCHRGFPYPKDVKRHLSSHNGGRFGCTVLGCDKTFTRKDNCQRHMRTHAGSSALSVASSCLKPSFVREIETAISADPANALLVSVQPEAEVASRPENALMGPMAETWAYPASTYSSYATSNQNTEFSLQCFVDPQLLRLP
ncbi:hypothetical protein Q7P37_005957 [Cladosporium fusiforme]